MLLLPARAVMQVGMAKNYWSSYGAWTILEALELPLVAELKRLVSLASFISASADEATACDRTPYMAVHVYIMIDWVREPLLVRVSVVRLLRQPFMMPLMMRCNTPPARELTPSAACPPLPPTAHLPRSCPSSRRVLTLPASPA